MTLNPATAPVALTHVLEDGSPVELRERARALRAARHILSVAYAGLPQGALHTLDDAADDLDELAAGGPGQGRSAAQTERDGRLLLAAVLALCAFVVVAAAWWWGS